MAANNDAFERTLIAVVAPSSQGHQQLTSTRSDSRRLPTNTTTTTKPQLLTAPHRLSPAIRYNSDRSVLGVGRPTPSSPGALRSVFHRRNGGTFSQPSFSGGSWSPVAVGAGPGAEALIRRSSFRLSEIISNGPNRTHSLTTVAVITGVFFAITLGTTLLVAAVCCRYSKINCRHRRRRRAFGGNATTERGGSAADYDCEMNEFYDVSDDATSDNDADFTESQSSIATESAINRKHSRGNTVARSRSESSTLAADSRTNLLFEVDTVDNSMSLGRSVYSSSTNDVAPCVGDSSPVLVYDDGSTGDVDQRCSVVDTDDSGEDNQSDANSSKKSYRSRLSEMFQSKQAAQQGDGYHRLKSRSTEPLPSCYSISRSVDEMMKPS